VIVVNWNSGTLLRDCLQSVSTCLEQEALDHEIIVVDNASTDGSANDLPPALPCRVLSNPANVGFGAACNQGARLARGEFLLFLNPDCIVAPGSTTRCIDELSDVAVGVAGIALEDATGHVARSCCRIPRFSDMVSRLLGLRRLGAFSDGVMWEWDHASDRDVDHVIGAFYLMRRALFESLGGFDETFFVYLEDLDLSFRVRQSGHRVRFLAHPASFHVGGGSSQRVKATRLFYATRSRMLYTYKHFPRWQGHLHAALTILVEPLVRSVDALARRSGAALKETWRGFAMLYRDLPHILAKARTL
jgi:GT2 family glycosyltransferase